MPPKSRSSTSKASISAPSKLNLPSTKSSSHTPAPKKSTSPPKTNVKAKEEDELDVFDDPRYSKVFRESKKAMGPAIHFEGKRPVHIVLQVFDSTEDWGPCSNMTRLQRWERAKRLGLEPPEEVGEILKSKPALTRPDLRDPVFNI